MAGRSLGTLTLDLLLKVGGFKQGADQAARTSDKLAKKMKGDAAEITGAFKKIGATLGVGLGIQQIASHLIAAAGAAVEFGESINRAAIQTGASAESLSGLAYAAKLADVEFVDLSKGITKMQKAISEASSGNKAAIESFALLGLKMSDLKGLDAAAQLEVVAEAISQVPDDADRATGAIDIFGKAGANLLPLFEKGAAGIRMAREEARALGLEMSGEAAKSADDLGDSITRLSESYAGLTRQMTGAIAPALTDFFDGVAASIKALNDESLTMIDRIGLIGKAYARANESDEGIFDPVTAFDLARAYKEVADEMERAANVRSPGGTSRGRPATPDYGARGAAARAAVTAAADPAAKEAAAAAKAAADEAAKAAAERLRIEAQALDELAQKYEDTYTRGAEAMAAARTESEVALDVLNEQRAALDELAEMYPNMAEAAMEAKAKLEEEFLEEPLIVATKIEIPPPPKTEIDVFKEHMAGELQDIVADFLVNPFDKGFDEILAGFAKMIAQMMAQALAADIVKALMGGGGGGTGGMMEFFAGLFETGGFVPPGQFGVAGESGPEIVMGGRTGQTVVPMAASAPAPQVNLRNINAFDVGVIRDYLVSAQGEEVMLNFIERNGTRVRMASVGG